MPWQSREGKVCVCVCVCRVPVVVDSFELNGSPSDRKNERKPKRPGVDPGVEGGADGCAGGAREDCLDVAGRGTGGDEPRGNLTLSSSSGRTNGKCMGSSIESLN